MLCREVLCRERGGGSSSRLRTFPGSRRWAERLSGAGRLEGHGGCVNALSFSGSGRLLASGSDDATVRLWDVARRTCVATLYGATSNVFATGFLAGGGGDDGGGAVISAGNDGDIWLHNVEGRAATAYRVHARKVLRLSVNSAMPDTFLSCSADGTVRMIDTRVHYRGVATTHTFAELEGAADGGASDEENGVIPQAFGGGRRQQQPATSDGRATLVVRYARGLRSRLAPPLYSVDFHPTDGRTFIVGAADGNVRRFDLRMIRNHDASSYVNIYRNIALPAGVGPRVCDVTGCVFSNDGTRVLASCLNDDLYCFDADRNFENEGVDFFAPPRRRVRRDASPQPQSRSARRHHIHFSESRTPEAEPEPAAAAAAAAAAAEHEAYACSICGSRNYPGMRYRCLVCGNAFEMCHECKQAGRETESHRADHPSVLLPLPGSTPTPSPEPAARPETLGVHLVLRPEDLLTFFSLLGARQRQQQREEDGATAAPAATAPTHPAEAPEDESAQLGRRAAAAEALDGIITRSLAPDAVVSAAAAAAAAEEDPSDSSTPQTFLRSFSGHRSSDTIKGCSFVGPNSEIAASGSDDWRVFLWDRESGELLRALSGHEGVVNVVVQHPHDTLMATSGIDDYILLWDCEGDELTDETRTTRARDLEHIRSINTRGGGGGGGGGGVMMGGLPCVQQ